MNKDILNIERQEYLTNIKPLLNDKRYEQLQDQFKIQYTYDALTIGGISKVSFEDVKKIIAGEKIEKYSEREVKEVLNHYKAIAHVYQLVKNKQEMTEDVIKDLHEILVNGILAGGSYRNVNIRIPGATHQPPDYIKVYDRMKRYFYTLSSYGENKPIEKAVFAQAELAKVHPFLDANGRLARLVMNYYLMKENYLAVSMPASTQKQYIEVLEKFKVEKDINPFVCYIEGLLLQRYQELNEVLQER